MLIKIGRELDIQLADLEVLEQTLVFVAVIVEWELPHHQYETFVVSVTSLP
jgi:hypothetical protein